MRRIKVKTIYIFLCPCASTRLAIFKPNWIVKQENVSKERKSNQKVILHLYCNVVFLQPLGSLIRFYSSKWQTFLIKTFWKLQMLRTCLKRLDCSGMFSIKFMVPVISFGIFSEKFLVCVSLKNYGKKAWKISPDSINMIVNIELVY